ncbi:MULTISPECIES: SusC/RagA family TonB-linked outer membrane protein [unclassified Carboxylicivirga]|uniref:SusC/RagA family TonB-linked outer membrane protein n=1 Tax=Carboxylicivirga TaxID=1628153 RepID=UPI003D357E7B
MRLSFALIFSSVLAVSASSYSQSKLVSLKVKNISISNLFEEIRKQSGYSFFFNETNVAELNTVTLHKNNISVEEVLEEVLANTNLEFTMVGDVIVIKPKEADLASDQQNETKIIKGRVTDAQTGESLPGVNVLVKDGILGTVTDIDGNFILKSPKPVKTLVFSFIGYEALELAVQGQTELNVKLVTEMLELGEVVATGYYTVDKRELTSSIASVKAEDLDMMGALSVDRMLEGKAAGLMVTNISSTPGAASKVRIRGGSTFTGNQSPLWVIDGVIYEDPVPLTADEINSFDNINLIGNALTGINPQDIAKIDILKDASATAIYGTRAANGVIVITTKRGKEGSASLSYSGGLSFVQAPAYTDLDLMNSKERIAVSREMYEKNLGFSQQYTNVDRLGYEGALLNLWDGSYNFDQFQNQVSYLETLNADWFGELYQPAISQKHSVSASGGSKGTRYYLSVGYDDQQGTDKGVDLNRITARSNIDLDLRDNLLLSFQLNGSVQKAKYNHNSINLFNEAYYTSRAVPIYGEDGEYFFQSKEIYDPNGANNLVYGRYNILREMENSERNITNKDFALTASLKWKFLKNFRLNTMLSYRNTTNLKEEWITEDTWYVAKLRTYDQFEELIEDNINEGAMVPFGGIYNGGMMSQDTYSLRNQLNFNKVLKEKHVINVNLGQEIRSAQYWGATGFAVPGYNHYQGRGFISLPKVSSTAGTVGLDFSEYDYDYAFNWLTNQGSQSVYPSITDQLKNTFSLFAIFNYVYNNRYVVNFNMRSDGSNTFGQYQRYKFKPTWSASGRWNIHNENFLSHFEFFDELALRASYGVRGTMPNTTPYLIIRDYGRNEVVYSPETIAQLSSFPNANLRWEKSETVNAGLNYSILNGRISGAFDYAYTKSSDLIQLRPVSLVNGTSTQAYNSGIKDVTSYEFTIHTVNIKKRNFGWSTNFNFSYDKDRVLKGFEDGAEQNLTIQNYLNGSIYREGFPTNGFFSYQFDGLNEEGLPTFKHLVEENMTAEEQLEAALVYEGSRLPLYYGGFGTEFKYRNLRFSANFSYKLGYKTRLLKLYNGNQNLPLPYENMHNAFIDRWQQPGDELHTDIPAISNHNMSYTYSLEADGYNRIYVTNYGKVVPEGRSAWWMYDYSDARVVNGDHIRLQTVTLSYNLPKELLKGAGISNLNIGVQASNVAVWAFDKELRGQDPEQVNGIGLPSLPTYSMSLNMSF